MSIVPHEPTGFSKSNLQLGKTCSRDDADLGGRSAHLVRPDRVGPDGRVRPGDRQPMNLVGDVMLPLCNISLLGGTEGSRWKWPGVFGQSHKYQESQCTAGHGLQDGTNTFCL